jgi:hypothetical protein
LSPPGKNAPAERSGLDRVFARSERVVGRRVAGEFILVPLVGRGADLDSIFNLNRVGAFVWERLDGSVCGAEIVARMVEHFEIDEPAAASDYGQFIDQLQAIGAVAERDA